MAGQVSTEVVTVPVTLGPQLNDPQFQGWFMEGGALEAINCSTGSSLFQTAGYAECCAIGATNCNAFWTRCAGSLSAVGTATDACTSCHVMKIYEQYPINADPNTQIVCFDGFWPASSIFRTVISSTTTDSILTLSGASPSATSNVASNTQAGQGSGGTSSTSSSTSNAWIAGAVIGPVVALLIIIALLVWGLRLRKKKLRAESALSPQYAPVMGARSERHMSYGNQSYGSPSYRDRPGDNVAYKPQRYEMDGRNEAYELSGGSQSQELHAYSPQSKPPEMSDVR